MTRSRRCAINLSQSKCMIFGPGIAGKGSDWSFMRLNAYNAHRMAPHCRDRALKPKDYRISGIQRDESEGPRSLISWFFSLYSPAMYCRSLWFYSHEKSGNVSSISPFLMRSLWENISGELLQSTLIIRVLSILQCLNKPGPRWISRRLTFKHYLQLTPLSILQLSSFTVFCSSPLLIALHWPFHSNRLYGQMPK